MQRKQYAYGETPLEEIRAIVERNPRGPQTHERGTFAIEADADMTVTILKALKTDGAAAAVALRVTLLAALGIEEA